jgi:hypothetical protein
VQWDFFAMENSGKVILIVGACGLGISLLYLFGYIFIECHKENDCKSRKKNENANTAAQSQSFL